MDNRQSFSYKLEDVEELIDVVLQSGLPLPITLSASFNAGARPDEGLVPQTIGSVD
jgi:hypothetical protein